ncbi:MAG: 50S ribosomal protein L18 [Eubacteriales bacterium]|nr:50S ribosomal protein L18 [Eubacteriales bacterium]
MIKKVSRNLIRRRKHARTRKFMSGTPERPRLTVFRSNKHVYAQIIDDLNAKTLVAASSLEKEINAKTNNLETAAKVGKLLAERAVAQGIEEVVFDRSGYIYHGRIAALAEACREAGLKF